MAYQILQILDMSLTISRPERYHDGRPRRSPSAPNSRDSTPDIVIPVNDNSKLESSEPSQITKDEQAVEATIKTGKNWRGPKRPHGTSGAIELRLVAAVLIAFKLLYGLDGFER